MQEEVVNLRQEVEQLKSQQESVAQYIEKKKEEVRAEFDIKMQVMMNMMEEMRKKGKGGAKSLIHIKDMKPDKLGKAEGWKKWRSDVLDYCEEQFPGMKD
eukprot:6547100-Karenia_brevis.AAC.1